MAAVITGAIPTANFELIRDRIGQILADEFASQYTITGNEVINLADNVYIDRIISIDPTEAPLLNVIFGGAEHISKSIKEHKFRYTYFIDGYAASDSDDDTKGDTLAAIKLQRILAVTRAILEDPQYKTLNYEPPFLSSTHVASIKIMEPSPQDAKHTIMGRIEFMVEAHETVELLTKNKISDHLTQVTLYNTTKGYRYMWSIKADVPIGVGGSTFTIPPEYTVLTLLAIDDGAQVYNTGFSRSGNDITMSNGVTFAPGQLITLIFELNDYSAAITVATAGGSFTIPTAFAGKQLLIFDGTQAYASGFTVSGTTVTMTNDVSFTAGQVLTILAGTAVTEITVASAGNTCTVPVAYTNFEAVIIFDGPQGYNRSVFTQTDLVCTMTSGITFTANQKLTLLLR